MKIFSYRTTSPFDNRNTNGDPSLSPTTEKSVMPFNNVTTIQDILDGSRTIADTYPHARGSWASGEDSEKNYREKGNDYKRRERDESILFNMDDKSPREKQNWKVKVPGGSRYFDSFESALAKIREKSIPFKYLSRAAQVNKGEVNRVAIIAESMDKVLLVNSINPIKAVKETGSAFCIAPGYFATCAHVVESYNKSLIPENTSLFGQKSILKLIQNGRAYSAKLVDFDLNNDIAILKANIPIDPIVLDGNVQAGEDVIVIGSPHGYENNVSTGTIGGINRKVYQYQGAPSYIFVDAAVFPGSSGGPVIKSSNGQVVGMITLIVSSEGDYGLNAALPSSYIRQFCAKYIS